VFGRRGVSLKISTGTSIRLIEFQVGIASIVSLPLQ
jgi:hypothetical protein